jgi:glycosyltransferase involved in cell wall biosynthesis
MLKISIAICTYNGETYLQEQLNSYAAQTRLPDEVVVCDDCSSDKTVKIIRDFAERAPFPVRLYANETNLRSTKNFEKAISLCEGDIIFLSDQDDVWHKNKLEKFTAAFETDEQVGLVFCDGELVDENLISLNISAWQAIRFDKKRQNSVKNGDGLAVILDNNVVTGCMMAFRAKYKDLLLPIPNDIQGVIHDHWIALLMFTVVKVNFIPERLVKYRQHSGQQLGLSITAEAPVGLREKIATRHDFQVQQFRLEDLKKRLSDRITAQAENYQGNKKDLLNDLNERIRHVQARTKITKSRKLGVVLIIKELFTLRYHRYSNGWRSAVKDLLLYSK